ncbi:MAG: hypothetical protein AMXMBFR82_05390 [Candidatus Hydrogenedentota bacterium]
MCDGNLPITQRSGYRIMWMLTMFDLPVVHKLERKEATRFRQDLLDMGFEMAQFSVYMRCCVTRERTDALINRVRKSLPTGGKVAILLFTDKQYENMLHFIAGKPAVLPSVEGQLALF